MKFIVIDILPPDTDAFLYINRRYPKKIRYSFSHKRPYPLRIGSKRGTLQDYSLQVHPWQPRRETYTTSHCRMKCSYNSLLHIMAILYKSDK